MNNKPQIKKGYKKLYQRLRGYDIESLRIELDFQLQCIKNKDPSKAYHNHQVGGLRQYLIGFVESTRRLKTGSAKKRVEITLEQVMAKSPKLAYEILDASYECTIDYGCKL